MGKILIFSTFMTGLILTLLSVPVFFATWVLFSYSDLVDQASRLNIQNFTHPSGDIKSEAFAYLGIGIGLVVSGASFVFNGVKDLGDLNRTRDFLKEDFENINNQQIEIIPKLKDTLESLHRNDEFINGLFGQQKRYLQIMIDHLPIMHFSLWDAALSNFKDLDKNEQKRILNVYNEIVKLRGYLQRANDPLVQTLSHLASSSSFDGNELVEIRRFLISTFEYNLSVARNVYDELQKLNDIKWLEAKNWKVLENKPLVHIGAPIK